MYVIRKAFLCHDVVSRYYKDPNQRYDVGKITEYTLVPL